MALPLPTDYAPVEANTSAKLPAGEHWLYEPKWDGFRCIAFKDGAEVDLRSKSGKPLGRYFPDLTSAIQEVKAPRFALDGEIVIPIAGSLVFDELLLLRWRPDKPPETCLMEQVEREEQSALGML